MVRETHIPSKQRTHLSSVTSKGQATIPADIRRRAGISTGDFVHFKLENGSIIVEKAQSIDASWNNGQSAMLSEWDNTDEDVYND
jgi:antitoxin PrlF